MSLSSASQDYERTIYSVSEITNELKLELEHTFPNLWVKGELSDTKVIKGHYYFTLKDERAKLHAIMFRRDVEKLLFQPADGHEVLVCGQITVYQPFGRIQIRAFGMEPHGKGSLQLAFEQLKDKLQKKGFFDVANKKSLPLLPQRIGIVTSPTGAVIQDLKKGLFSRFPNLDVLIYPSRVQGEHAATEIARGISVLNMLGNFDVLIIGRGGGSQKDLWPFNEEKVARAIAESRIPVVSAVGHETDWTISDLVADHRASTPTAAAEEITPRKEDLQEKVSTLVDKIEIALVRKIEQQKQNLNSINNKIALHFVHQISLMKNALNSKNKRLSTQQPAQVLAKERLKLTRLGSQLVTIELTERERTRKAIDTLSAKLHALSPLAVLNRGYSLIWTDQGKLLRNTSGTKVGNHIRVELSQGELDCRVENIRVKNGQ